jgi:aryl-alcohol dehydrogenase-like predicted oxidoreductase
MQRREFLKGATWATGLAMCSDLLARSADGAEQAGKAGEVRVGDMPCRVLGRTGERVSAIGLGGYHIGTQQDEAESIRIIRTAIDRGMTFMDNCWDYHNGGSEERMGRALRDGYRDKVFLMSKFDGRTKASAARQIDESLKRLATDRLDLMQIHEVIRLEDPDVVFAEGGAMEALHEAKKAGKVRYVGFTGHKDPLVHLRMLDVADQYGFRFDAAQMPLNVMDAHFRSFGRLVVPRLVKDGIGVLGMKSMGCGIVLQSKTATPVECLQYALSLPTSVVIAGIDSMRILEQALKVAREFKPLSEAEMAALLGRTRQVAMTGRYEPFKTSPRFDGTAYHPEWLR